MKKKYVTGIDCGGSKTTVTVTDLNLCTVFSGAFGGINVQRDRSPEINEIFTDIFSGIDKTSKVRIRDILTVVAGAAGAGRENTKGKLSGILEKLGFKNNAYVVTDMYTAYKSVFYDDSGILVSSGTGSFAYAIDEKRKEIRAGGWGYLAGDEGSGFHIGRKAIAAALKSFDGRTEKSLLENLLCKKFGLHKIEEIIPLIYKSNNAVADIAEITPLVFEAARQKDMTAQSIIEHAADELISHAKAVKKHLPEKPSRVKLVLAGGVPENNEAFVRIIEKKLPESLVMAPGTCKPVKGAVIAGFEFSGIKLSASALDKFMAEE